MPLELLSPLSVVDYSPFVTGVYCVNWERQLFLVDAKTWMSIKKLESTALIKELLCLN